MGIMTACAVGTFLYKRTFFEEENRLWLFLTLVMELVAYGVYILEGQNASKLIKNSFYFLGC